MNDQPATRSAVRSTGQEQIFAAPVHARYAQAAQQLRQVGIDRPTQAMIADFHIGDDAAFETGRDASPCNLDLWKFRHVYCRFCVALL